MPVVPLTALSLALAASTAVPPEPPAGPIDLIERLFGASDVAWVVGNGGLTVGLSALGEATVLSWPSPSYTDQLLHLGSNDPDVRRRRNMASHEAMGAFIGLRVLRGDLAPETVFPRVDWTMTQGYAPAPILVTTMAPPVARPGVTSVEVADWVDPGSDAWIREVTVRGDASVGAVEVLGYWNLSPTVSRIPQLPLADWVADAYNDYAALWDEANHAVVHFRPAGRGDLAALTDLVVRPAVDYGPVGAALAEGPLDEARAAALLAGPEGSDDSDGAWLAVGAREATLGHHIGFDATPICELVGHLADNVAALPGLYPRLTLPLDPALVDVLRCDRTAAAIAAENGWSELPRGAFEDVSDGTLQATAGAAGQVDEALSAHAEKQPDGSFVARFVVGAGHTLREARAALTAGRAATRAHAAEAFAAAFGKIRWPSSPALRAASERALTNLLLAQDRATGAIVASVARQPSYALDWPRDGAFFDYALDLAGLPERATKHARFTLTTQRQADATAEPLINGEPPPDPDDPQKKVFPAGGWEMNAYADGLVGGNIRWEIDNAALAVWTLCEHGERLPEAERAAWRDEVWPVVSRAADLLARWRDAATGLHAPANEDDNAAYTQTLHGAATTWRGLRSAADLAGRRGDAAAAARWGARADELRAAIDTQLREPAGTGLYKEGLDAAQNPGNAAGGASAWALWPAGLDEPAGQIDALLDLAEARLDPNTGGGAYVTKLLLAAAMRGSKAQKARARALLERFVATGAWLGETYVTVPGTATFEARVANPHVWAGTLVYLTAMATEPAASAAPDDDDGCAGGAADLGALGLAAALFALLRRRHLALAAVAALGLGACGDDATSADVTPGDATATDDTAVDDATATDDATIPDATGTDDATASDADADVTPPSDTGPDLDTTPLDVAVDAGPDVAAAEPFGGLETGAWTWIDVPGTACDDGSPTGIGVSRGTAPDVLVFFMGGGACWSYLTCWTLNSSVHGPYGKSQFDAVSPGFGVMNRLDAQNPFKDWSYVFVPYCTGDLHGGDAVVDHTNGVLTKATHHVGARNVAAWLARAAATFPAPPRLVVMGASAGGYGATLHYDHLRAAFDPAAGWLVDDSGPMLVGDAIVPSLRETWYDTWNLGDLLEPVCGAGCRADFSLLHTKLAARWPDDGQALLSSLGDGTISVYVGLTPVALAASLYDLASKVLEPAGARWFFVAGTTHTMSGNPESFSSHGVGLRAWLQAMLDGTGWTSQAP